MPPPEWSQKKVAEVAYVQTGRTPPPAIRSYYGHDTLFVTPADITEQKYVKQTGKMLSRSGVKYGRLVPKGSSLFVCIGSTIVKVGLAFEDLCTNQQINGVIPNELIDPEYLYYALSAISAKIRGEATQQAVPLMNKSDFSKFTVHVPTLEEQQGISRALSDVDELMETLGKLIVKSESIKQGMMQQLLTGEARFLGFTGKWSRVCLGEVAKILDNLRVPLSASQRLGRPGPFPYCGANGVLDYIDDYMIDDDVVLLAEDGGNFDQFHSRAIAYRIKGKIWVNNHAHVLKATDGGDTGYLFHALAHKDIRSYISSSTRSKLTRGELVRIEIALPDDIAEQQRLAELLTDADNLIVTIKQLVAKMNDIKRGMMQQLLTGRTRLPIMGEPPT